MSVHIIGSFPSPLYRAFNKEEYAQRFVEQGIFQLRPLPYYCKIEDANRKDKDEGEGRVVISMDRPVLTLDQKSGKILSQTNEFGPVYFGTSSINPRYIQCFSGPQVNLEYLACQYGQHIVRINQPITLVDDVAAHLEQRLDLPSEMWVDCIQVRYDKDQSVSELPEPASQERIRMSYGQKDPRFSKDCEYRLVLTLPISISSCPVEIEVKLQKKLEYTEILRL